MFVVANHPELCIKVLTNPNPKSCARMLREVTILQKLTTSHYAPHIIAFGEKAFVMDYFMNFKTLDSLCGGYPGKGSWTMLPRPYDSFKILVNALTAIQDVHNCGFVHRDIKANNILVNVNSDIKLIDFGLCASITRTGDDEDELEKELTATVTMESETFKNALMTLPEFASGADISYRRQFASDISLIAALFLYMTRIVYNKRIDETYAAFQRHAEEFSVQLRYFLMRSLMSGVSQRFQTAEDALEAVRCTADQANEHLQDFGRMSAAKPTPVNDLVALQIQALLIPIVGRTSRLRWKRASLGHSCEIFTYAGGEFRCVLGSVKVYRNKQSLLLRADTSTWSSALCEFLALTGASPIGDIRSASSASSSMTARAIHDIQSDDLGDESEPVDED